VQVLPRLQEAVQRTRVDQQCDHHQQERQFHQIHDQTAT
jgi:hypothetical protein